MAKKKVTKKKLVKSKSKRKKRRSTSVPDTYRGFSLQATRLLFYLLDSDMDDIVSLEYFEDVGVEKKNGEKLAEQDKSYLSSNPLSDRAVVFWKTLRNWVDAALDGSLPPSKCKYVTYAPNATLGAIAQSFHNAISGDDAEKALLNARNVLETDGELKISEAAKEHVEIVFAADVELMRSILMRYSIDASSESTIEPIKNLLQKMFVGEQSYDVVIRQAHGWIKQRVDAQLAAKKPVRIVKQEFHQPLLNFVRTHDRENILRSVASKPKEEEIAAELSFRNYVKQLRVIDLEEEDVLESVNDFLCASIDRTTWSDMGIISEESLELLEKELNSTWRNIKRRTGIAHKNESSASQGQVLFSDCMEHDARLDNQDTPRQFVRGSWHAMADDLTVGWHPQFKTMMKDAHVEPTPSREEKS